MEKETRDELKAQNERISEAMRVQSLYISAMKTVSALADLAPTLCMWVVPKGNNERKT